MSDLIEFEIVWLDWDQHPFDATIVRNHDLSDAIAAACILMLRQSEAHGFFVRRKEHES